MLAYTAWDGLHAMATQVDADLTLRADGHVSLAPHRAGATSPVWRRFATRLTPALVVLIVAASSGW